jgi:hypothetical protein
MVDWTPEAIEAAHRAMFQEPYDGTTAAMIGAGLDAAAAVQGIKDEEITREEEMRDIVERLNTLADTIMMGEKISWGSDSAIMREAATEITRLREENARLLGLLREAHVKMDANNLWSNLRNRVAAAIREGGKDEN